MSSSRRPPRTPSAHSAKTVAAPATVASCPPRLRGDLDNIVGALLSRYAETAVDGVHQLSKLLQPADAPSLSHSTAPTLKRNRSDALSSASLSQAAADMFLADDKAVESLIATANRVVSSRAAETTSNPVAVVLTCGKLLVEFASNRAAAARRLLGDDVTRLITKVLDHRHSDSRAAIAALDYLTYFAEVQPSLLWSKLHGAAPLHFSAFQEGTYQQVGALRMPRTRFLLSLITQRSPTIRLRALQQHGFLTALVRDLEALMVMQNEGESITLAVIAGLHGMVADGSSLGITGDDWRALLSGQLNVIRALTGLLSRPAVADVVSDLLRLLITQVVVVPWDYSVQHSGGNSHGVEASTAATGTPFSTSPSVGDPSEATHSSSGSAGLPNFLLLNILRSLQPSQRLVDANLALFILHRAPELIPVAFDRLSKSWQASDVRGQLVPSRPVIGCCNFMLRILRAPLPASTAITLIKSTEERCRSSEWTAVVAGSHVAPLWLCDFVQSLLQSARNHVSKGSAASSGLFAALAFALTTTMLERAWRMRRLIDEKLKQQQVINNVYAHGSDFFTGFSALDVMAFETDLDAELKRRLPAKEEFVATYLAISTAASTVVASTPPLQSEEGGADAAAEAAALAEQRDFLIHRGLLVAALYNKALRLRTPLLSLVPASAATIRTKVSSTDASPFDEVERPSLPPSLASPEGLRSVGAFIASSSVNGISLVKLFHISFGGETQGTSSHASSKKAPSGAGPSLSSPPFLHGVLMWLAHHHRNEADHDADATSWVLHIVHSCLATMNLSSLVAVEEVALWCRYLTPRTVPVFLHFLNSVLQQSTSNAAGRLASELAAAQRSAIEEDKGSTGSSSACGVLHFLASSFVVRTREKLAAKEGSGSFVADPWQLHLRSGALDDFTALLATIQTKWRKRVAIAGKLIAGPGMSQLEPESEETSFSGAWTAVALKQINAPDRISMTPGELRNHVSTALLGLLRPTLFLPSTAATSTTTLSSSSSPYHSVLSKLSSILDDGDHTYSSDTALLLAKSLRKAVSKINPEQTTATTGITTWLSNVRLVWMVAALLGNRLTTSAATTTGGCDRFAASLVDDILVVMNQLHNNVLLLSAASSTAGTELAVPCHRSGLALLLLFAVASRLGQDAECNASAGAASWRDDVSRAVLRCHWYTGRLGILDRLAYAILALVDEEGDNPQRILTEEAGGGTAAFPPPSTPSSTSSSSSSDEDDDATSMDSSNDGAKDDDAKTAVSESACTTKSTTSSPSARGRRIARHGDRDITPKRVEVRRRALACFHRCGFVLPSMALREELDEDLHDSSKLRENTPMANTNRTTAVDALIEMADQLIDQNMATSVALRLPLRLVTPSRRWVLSTVHDEPISRRRTRFFRAVFVDSDDTDIVGGGGALASSPLQHIAPRSLAIDGVAYDDEPINDPSRSERDKSTVPAALECLFLRSNGSGSDDAAGSAAGGPSVSSAFSFSTHQDDSTTPDPRYLGPLLFSAHSIISAAAAANSSKKTVASEAINGSGPSTSPSSLRLPVRSLQRVFPLALRLCSATDPFIRRCALNTIVLGQPLLFPLQRCLVSLAKRSMVQAASAAEEEERDAPTAMTQLSNSPTNNGAVAASSSPSASAAASVVPRLRASISAFLVMSLPILTDPSHALHPQIVEALEQPSFGWRFPVRDLLGQFPPTSLVGVPVIASTPALGQKRGGASAAQTPSIILQVTPHLEFGLALLRSSVATRSDWTLLHRAWLDRFAPVLSALVTGYPRQRTQALNAIRACVSHSDSRTRRSLVHATFLVFTLLEGIFSTILADLAVGGGHSDRDVTAALGSLFNAFLDVYGAFVGAPIETHVSILALLRRNWTTLMQSRGAFFVRSAVARVAILRIAALCVMRIRSKDNPNGASRGQYTRRHSSEQHRAGGRGDAIHRSGGGGGAGAHQPNVKLTAIQSTLANATHASEDLSALVSWIKRELILPLKNDPVALFAAPDCVAIIESLETSL